MNFEFLGNCEITEDWMRDAYKKLGDNLKEAEEIYRRNPAKCGVILRGTVADICRIYNRYYEIGFDESASIEEFLCYTGDDAHNVLVSRFLSVVRKEQRDKLTKLRVLGDDCCRGRGEESSREFEDRMAGNAKRMMETMMGTLTVMCTKINGQTGIEKLRFEEGILPAKEQEELCEEKKQSLFSRIFKK